jgi:hypothetical protein
MTTTSTLVLNYATPDQLAPARATVWLVRMFAAFHLLLGLGVSIASVAMIMDRENAIVIGLQTIAAAMHIVVGVLMFRPRPQNWRMSRVMLATLLFPALGFIVFGAVLFVMYHEGKGWDQLGAAIGVIVGAIASALYWLNLITLWYLMRPHPRAVFGVSVTDSFIGRKTFMRTMAALWLICVAVCLIAWIAP